MQLIKGLLSAAVLAAVSMPAPAQTTVKWSGSPVLHVENRIPEPALADNGSSSPSRRLVKDSLFPVSALGGFVSSYGADLKGSSDSTAALQSCLNETGPGGVCIINYGATLKLLGDITIPAQTRLDCQLPFPDDADANPSLWGTLPSLKLDGRHSVAAAGAGVTISNCLIIRDGMTFPENSFREYAGKAIQGNSFPGLTLLNDIVIGFDTAVDAYGVSRVMVDHFYADGTGNAIPVMRFGKNSDSGIIRRVRLQALAAASPYTCANRLRGGTGFQMLNDGGEFLDDIVVQDFQTADYNFTRSLVIAGKLWADFYGTFFGCQTGASVAVTISELTGDIQHLDINSTNRGILIGGSGSLTISDLFLNSVTQECVRVSNPIPPTGSFFFHVGVVRTAPMSCGSYAFDYQDSTQNATLVLSDGYLIGVNGGRGPYIKLGYPIVPNYRLQLGNIITDLPAGSSLVGGAAPSFVNLSSAAALAIPTNGNQFVVNGTTNITSFTGVWGGREFTLIFSEALTITQGNNILLANGAPFTSGSGSAMIRFLCFGSGNETLCKEVSRSL